MCFGITSFEVIENGGVGNKRRFAKHQYQLALHAIKVLSVHMNFPAFIDVLELLNFHAVSFWGRTKAICVTFIESNTYIYHKKISDFFPPFENFRVIP